MLRGQPGLANRLVRTRVTVGARPHPARSPLEAAYVGLGARDRISRAGRDGFVRAGEHQGASWWGKRKWLLNRLPAVAKTGHRPLGIG
jgi:hypothetical protein